MEQLLNYFQPEHYNLKLKINKQTEVVQGQISIIGQPLSAKVKLHAKNLKITSAKANHQPVGFKHQGDVLVFDNLSLKEQTQLDLSYTFDLSHNMLGAYLSTYQYENREERVVATQFESHYARQCFPCIDDPAAKATFSLSISSSDPEDTILSNMPLKSTQPDPENPKQKIFEFETTPKMSTYLLAFCVGKFRSKTTTNAHGVKVTTYQALNQNPSLLDFPNQLAADTLVYYDDLFQTPYPLPKLDQIALPDFDAGAMENWGLVTYRESCLLADQSTSADSREYIATVITHELAHQWFGNLVTMQWWDDLWLNESFASVIEYFAVDALHPEYNIWQNFFTGSCLAALRRDALPGVQSVHQAVNHPDEINTLFDGAIVYAKGAHLMFMLIRLIGQDKFFAGIHDYFKKHQYQNTIGDDLWSALQPYADFNVKSFMDTWISQPGYPVITGTKQQRFLLNNSTDDSTWSLPEIRDDMSGHYIINLSAKEFNSKLKNFANLSLEQKLRLLIDRQLLAKTDFVSSDSLIDLVLNFKQETSQPIWEIILTIAHSLKLFFDYQDVSYRTYQKFLADLVKPQIQRLGLKSKSNESAGDTKLRPALLATALLASDCHLIEDLAEFYQTDLLTINANIRFAVLFAKLIDSNEDILPDFIKAYEAAADQELKADLLSVIAKVEKPENIQKVIKLLKQPKTIRLQDHLSLVARLLANPATRSITTDWIYQNWDYILEITNSKSIDDYVRVLAGSINTHSDADRFFQFFDNFKNQPALIRVLEVAHSDIPARLQLIATDIFDVQTKLSKLYDQN